MGCILRLLIWQFGLPINIKLSNGYIRYLKEISFDEWCEMGFDNKSVIADPLFIDIENDNFRLKDNSPAFEMGFQALPLEKMGPYKSELRASWPIVDAEGAREYPLI